MCKPTELDDERLIDHIAECLEELTERLSNKQTKLYSLKDKISELGDFLTERPE